MIIPNANHRLSPDDAEASLLALSDRVSVVLVQLEIPLGGRAAGGRGLSSASCDWCWIRHRRSSMPPAVWRGVSLVTPNELEAEVLTGIAVTDHHSAVRAARGSSTAVSPSR